MKKLLWLLLLLVLGLLWLVWYLWKVPQTADCPTPAPSIPANAVPNQYIVQYEEGVDAATVTARTAELEALGDVLKKQCQCGQQLQLWEVGPGVDIEERGQTLEDKTGIDSIDFNVPVQTGPILRLPGNEQPSPNERNKEFDLWSSPNPPQAGAKPVSVAMIDTGVDPAHPGVSAILWKNKQEAAGAGPDDDQNCLENDLMGWDFAGNDNDPTDSSGHGTHLSGLVANGYPNNSGLELMALRFHDGNDGYLFDGICAIYYAVDKGAKVINLSWGYYNATPSPALAKALAYARNKDVLVVTSAGNEGRDNDAITEKHWPSDFKLIFDNMLSVAALNYYRTDLPSFSNFGAHSVDLAAPGTAVISTLPGGGTGEMSGSSMSAAIVSRTASIIRAQNPEYSAPQVRLYILGNTRFLPALVGKVQSAGALDQAAAFGAAGL